MAIYLVFQKCCSLYDTIVKAKSRVTITSVLDKILNIVGTANLMVILEPILQVDLRDIAVRLGNNYIYI